MSFKINTNIAAMNAHANSIANSRELQNSLGRLSSGLRISTAADDASGMTIADSLRSQASALGQSIKNGNDAIGIVQTADKAMDEQIKILDTIKRKAVQAAQDGQTTSSRRALQSDISRLLQELDNIANTTAFNGQTLLNGGFSNKNFQIGAYSNETIKVSIGATNSDKIGHTRFETFSSVSGVVEANQQATLTLTGAKPGDQDLVIKATASAMTNKGLNALAEQVNASSADTGIRASVKATYVLAELTNSGVTAENFKINGVTIGKVGFKAKDDTATLVNAINKQKDSTGVTASRNIDGRIVLASVDGRAIKLENSSAAGGTDNTFYGSLTLIDQSGKDIRAAINGGISAGTAKEATMSLRDMIGSIIKKEDAVAMGYFNSGDTATDQSSGVITYGGAQAMIDVAESAQKLLDSIRADLGSVQNQLIATINNISVTQVNVKSAESQIRDVDFAEESANFSKFNILAQSGSYAMSQANAVQQNVLRLLQ